jgi:hypothetical protein
MEEKNLLDEMLNYPPIRKMIESLPSDQRVSAQDYIEKILRPTYSRVVNGLKSEKAQNNKENI